VLAQLLLEVRQLVLFLLLLVLLQHLQQVLQQMLLLLVLLLVAVGVLLEGREGKQGLGQQQ
jgi:hypothetical protein